MLESEVSRNDYVGNSAVATYAYTFRVVAEEDLSVVVADTNGDETPLVLNVDYTVSGVGETAGGAVTLVSGKAWMTSGKLTTGYTLTIRRDPAAKQETDFRNQSSFYQEAHEDAFDAVVMMIQALRDDVDRSMKLKVTEAGTAAKTEFPSASERAGMVLAFDEDGNPVTAIPVSSYLGAVTRIGFSALTELPDATDGPMLCMAGPAGARALYFSNGVSWEAVVTMKD